MSFDQFGPGVTMNKDHIIFKQVTFDQSNQVLIARKIIEDYGSRSASVIGILLDHCVISDLDWFIGFFLGEMSAPLNIRDTLESFAIGHSRLTNSTDWHKMLLALSQAPRLTHTNNFRLDCSSPGRTCLENYGVVCQQVLYPDAACRIANPDIRQKLEAEAAEVEDLIGQSNCDHATPPYLRIG